MFFALLGSSRVIAVAITAAPIFECLELEQARWDRVRRYGVFEVERDWRATSFH
jgi:hypothetical protein